MLYPRKWANEEVMLLMSEGLEWEMDDAEHHRKQIKR